MNHKLNIMTREDREDVVSLILLIIVFGGASLLGILVG